MAGEPSNPPEEIALARIAARAQQHDAAAPGDTPVSAAAAAAAAAAPVDVSLQQQMQQQQADLAALQAHNARLTAEVGELEGTRRKLRGVISQMTAIYDVDQEGKAQLQARLDAQLGNTIALSEAMSGMLNEHVGRISATTAPAALTPETAPILPPPGISDADKSCLYAPFGVVWREHNRRKQKADDRAGKWCQACDDGHFTHQCPRKQAMLGGGAAPLGNRINTARYKLSEFSWPTAASHGRKK